jgi:hypothetical protein
MPFLSDAAVRLVHDLPLPERIEMVNLYVGITDYDWFRSCERHDDGADIFVFGVKYQSS